jgi:predicted kinase
MKPKLIMLGGFAGCGKTTIANRYVTEHPLALSVEGDEIIIKLGQWRENIEEAVACKAALTSALVAAHLKRGHDVVLPYLLTNSQDAERFESLAHVQGADFYEVILFVEKEEALRRLFKRGTWGEEGLPPLTEADRPKTERLYDKMVEATSLRPKMIDVVSEAGDVEGTYKKFIEVLERE